MPKMTCNVPNCWSLLKSNKSSIAGFNRSVLHEVINTASDGGIKPLHVAALKGHRDSAVRGVQLSIMLHVAETRNVARKCTVAADSNVLILHYRKRI
ncbi:hypothetical protein Bca52824_043226 [Brassica carinata]|uniref:Uncharacterized protein n=1 Tax=Brassica carinata TaxID=52824 RepID=A0A8X7RYX0_BRACI|nr:hypothetical protein Bca52824_043226 [Brassica carinata]